MRLDRIIFFFFVAVSIQGSFDKVVLGKESSDLSSEEISEEDSDQSSAETSEEEEEDESEESISSESDSASSEELFEEDEDDSESSLIFSTRRFAVHPSGNKQKDDAHTDGNKTSERYDIDEEDGKLQKNENGSETRREIDGDVSLDPHSVHRPVEKHEKWQSEMNHESRIPERQDSEKLRRSLNYNDDDTSYVNINKNYNEMFHFAKQRKEKNHFLNSTNKKIEIKKQPQSYDYIFDHNHPNHNHFLNPEDIEVTHEERQDMAKVVADHVYNKLPTDMKNTSWAYGMVKKIVNEKMKDTDHFTDVNQQSYSQKYSRPESHHHENFHSFKGQGSYEHQPFNHETQQQSQAKHHEHQGYYTSYSEHYPSSQTYHDMNHQYDSYYAQHHPYYQNNAPLYYDHPWYQYHRGWRRPDGDYEDCDDKTTNTVRQSAKSDSVTKSENRQSSHTQNKEIIINIPKEKSCQCLAPINETQRTDYHLVNGFGWFKFHKTNANWHSARETCTIEGAHLAVLSSEQEAKWISNQAKTVNAQRVWLGIHDHFVEGKWLTILDQPLEATGFTKWKNEKSGKYGNKYNCGCLLREGASLVDASCEAKIPFVCKIPVHGPCRTVCH